MEFESGTHLGRYEIRSPLGKGGMGEVYLAQDTRLRRPVALKLLPAKFTEDIDRLQRFEQEACAASALNHPNIITIHEIGQEASVHFMATEFVEGETLRRRLQSEPLRLSEALDIATQIAAALSAAHAAGIIHRDIKPENIMVRPDGYIKILDFGLAKLTEQRTEMIDSQAPTIMRVATNPGTVMGTTHYMSPEQARGLDVDVRTDIWSLGVILYEMVKGRVPFEGGTTTDVLVSILDREPPPLTSISGDMPAELQRIIRKALSKDKEERYQTVKDLMIDLKSLRQELAFESKREHILPPDSTNRTTNETPGSAPGFETSMKGAAIRTGEFERAQTTLSAQSTASGIKQGKRRSMLVPGAIVISLLGIGYLLYAYLIRPHAANKPAVFLQNMQVTQITTNGKSRDAVISPDGKYVTYVVDDGGKQSLWLRQVATASNVQIIAPAEVTYQGLAFSHDGNYIYYNMWDRKGVGEIYQVPVLGGTPSRKVVHDVMPGVTVSPDDRRLAYIRGYAQENASSLLIANVDGTEEKKLVTCAAPDGCWGGAWSPDGKSFALVRWNEGGKYSTVVEYPVDGRPERQITSQRWMGVGQIGWLGDGSGLVIIAADQRNSPPQIWYISYPDGEARKITNDLNGYDNLSLTADSSTLVTVRGNGLSNIWALAANDTNSARQITSGNTEGALGMAWTPDGQIVYSSVASGHWDIWIMQPDGSNQKQLTFNASSNRTPTVSPDGRYIVFTSDRTSTDHIWRMNIDGSNPKELTNADGDAAPVCSPDGKWVIYSSWHANRQGLSRVSIDGGEPVEMLAKQLPAPSISPDGKFIASAYWDDQSDPQQWRVAIISYPEAQIVRTLATPPSAVSDVGSFTTRWTTDGRSLAYIDNRNGVSNIWSLPVDGSTPKALTDFKSERIFSFAWSSDGRQLAVARGGMNHDVFLIKGFK
ncbi:MAG: eukaryotic-like serine/threonine-protein kinase [Acidobacteriota bacterium]|jgi:serine/threonine protein kinase/Tol biopolymer transport system component|nr:eukaryotic-like serine/threonine-protein kinase [Acidobacteriota bacterium]